MRTWLPFLKSRRFGQYFIAYLVVFAILGAYGTYWLSRFPPHAFPVAKILSIAGIAYSLLGVLVLSEALVKNETVKEVLADWLSRALLWAHSMAAVAGVIAGLVTYILKLPSAHSALSFAFGFFVYSSLVGLFVDGLVANPLASKSPSPANRHQWLGLILVLTGLTLQLVAAIILF